MRKVFYNQTYERKTECLSNGLKPDNFANPGGDYRCLHGDKVYRPAIEAIDTYIRLDVSSDCT